MEHEPLLALAQGDQTQPKPTIGGNGKLLRTTQPSLLGEGAEEVARETEAKPGGQGQDWLGKQNFIAIAVSGCCWGPSPLVGLMHRVGSPLHLGDEGSLVLLESFPSLQPPARITSISPLHVAECR